MARLGIDAYGVAFSCAERRVLWSRQWSMLTALMVSWLVMVEPAPCDLLFGCAWLRRLGAGRFRWYRTSVTGALAAFLGLNMLQLSWAAEIEVGLRFLFITVYVVSLCFLFASVIQNRAGFAVVRRYYLVGVMVAAVTLLGLALAAYFRSTKGWLAPLYYANRPKGFFKDPNVAGPFAATGAVAAFSRLVLARQGRSWKQWLMFVLASAATVVTFSRGAVVNLLASLICVGCVALVRRRGMRFLLVALTLIFVILLITPIFTRVLEVFGQLRRFQGFMEDRGRVRAWRAGLEIILDAPWGIGPGQFEVFSPRYQLERGEARITPAAHNTYLRVGAENGVIGLGLLLIAFLGLLGISWQVAISARDKEVLADAAWLFGVWGGMLVEGLLIDTLHWRHLWIIAGFILAQQKLCKAEEPIARS